MWLLITQLKKVGAQKRSSLALRIAKDMQNAHCNVVSIRLLFR